MCRMLNANNCTIDEESGAVIFHISSELKAINALQKQIKDLCKENRILNEKLDTVLLLLEGGGQDGREMENTRFSKNHDK